MMKTADYWKDRFEQIEKICHDKGAVTYREIEEQYRKAQREIESQISVWYQRFAVNNGITMQEARRLLTSGELAELKWDVNEYIKYGQQNAIDGKWMKQLENASAKAHISRLEALKLQVQQQVEIVFGNQLDGIDKAMRAVYSAGYLHTAFEIQKGTGVGYTLAAFNQTLIDKILNRPWAPDGKNFSDRVWSNKQKLINELNTTLTQGIILGKDPGKIINAMSKKLDVSKTAAGRLVMTESAAFASRGQEDCFKELGVEEYEIVATLDSHTSEICQDMDGKVFKMSERQIGVNAPPFHVNCRTTTVPYFNDEWNKNAERAARDENGDIYYVPDDMTYKEWDLKFVENERGYKGIERSTQINRKIIYSNDYDKKFENLNENNEVTRVAKKECRKALEHRSGTHFEDLIFINPNTMEVLSRTDYNKKKEVKASKRMLKMLHNSLPDTIIAIHNHPESTLPSFSDLMLAYNRRYKYGLIACHNGDIYKYSVSRALNQFDKITYENRFDKFYDKKYSNIKKYSSIEEFFTDIEEAIGVKIEKL
jgi:phage head morphogenesis protein, SPP1 gp7 family